MKLATLFVAASVAFAASPSNQHGTRVTSQTTYLTATVEVPAPEDITLTSASDQTLIMQRLLALTQQGKLSDTAPVAVVLNGRTVSLVPPRTPTPSAVFETWVEGLPTDYMESVASGFSAVDREGNKITARRYVRDNFRHIYATYAVTVEMLAEAGKYRASFSTSPMDPDVKLAASERWKVLMPSNFPVPQVLDDGESLRVELYADAQTGQKLVEYLHVGKPASISLRKEASHDSYADDAQFALTSPHLKANGKTFEPLALPQTLGGPIMWAYVPGFGKYALSYLPHPELGYQLAGEVSGNSMIFSVDGNLFRLDCGDRIASGSGTYNVYAARDPVWMPADPADRSRFAIGSAPGVE